jgi:thiol-disulfide isomerase/thioredoxin
MIVSKICSVFAGLFVYSLAPLLAQGNVGVVFSPLQPVSDQHIQVCCLPDNNLFNTKRLAARIYFASIGDPGAVVSPPIVQEIKLRYDNGRHCGQFELPPGSLSILVTLHDSLGHVDNNGGKGYWTPIYKGGLPMPGSYGSIANLFGEASRLNGLRENNSYARSLYQDEFAKNPSLKRSFARRYLSTFDTNNPQELLAFRKELTQFTQFPDLSEHDLLTVKRFYGVIGEPDSARKYELLCIQRYPNGYWAIMTNSLKLALDIEHTEGLDEKWKKYLEFKERYGSSYPDAFTRHMMHDRMGQILRGMFFAFWDRKDLATWEAEIKALDESSRYRTNRRLVNMVTEKVKSSIQMKGPDPLQTFKPESPLGQWSPSEEQLLQYTEQLARESTEWHRKNLLAPRDAADPVLLPDSSINSIRAIQLGFALDGLSQILVLEQNPLEALGYSREAVKISNYSQSDINEHYIELLVRTNNIDEAKREASKVVRLERSTAAIQNFYIAAVRDSSAVTAQGNLDKRLKKEMINEVLPDVILVDEKGQVVSLSHLRGKTIVLDFWATWCAPCIIGMEPLSTVAGQYKDRNNVVFMFVNTDKPGESTRMRVSKKLDELGYDLDVYFDPELRTSKTLNVNAIPALIVVDPTGKVRFRHIGLLGSKGKQQMVDELTAMIEMANGH